MSAATGLYIAGCKDHPGTTGLSCCRIRRADGTPLNIREVWGVIETMDRTQADLLAACKAALAALTQPATFPADIAAAVKWLADAIARAEGRA